MAKDGIIKGAIILGSGYISEQKINHKIENNYTYHAPKPGQIETYTAVRDIAKELAIFIDGTCPESREKALAQTKLEECVMWANASIARN